MNQPIDPIGIVLTVGFVIFALSMIPVDRWLERRRLERRRNQAHRRMTQRRRVARWVRQ
jgi:hypothetical protein